MPASKDLTGLKFGKLTVLKQSLKRKNNRVVWLCQCDCGNFKEVTSADLNSKRVQSCGCYNSEYHKLKMEEDYNLTRKVFNRLTVLNESKIITRKNGKTERKWKCLCQCGNITWGSTNALLSGQKKSCGCLMREINGERLKKRKLNLLRQKFGRLTVIRDTGEKDGRNRTLWECKCDCGNPNLVLASTANLRRGHANSCGCLASKGENDIQKLLNENGISFTRQKSFDNCRFYNSQYKALFDFWVNNSYIIEYDGEQHFGPVQFGGISQKEAVYQYYYTASHDYIKNSFCLKNNIPIIRIPFSQKEIVLDDLLIDKSKFVLEENDFMKDILEIPNNCPCCGKKLEHRVSDSGAETLWCVNPICPEKMLSRFVQFVSKPAMNIDGLSEATLKRFIDIGCITKFSDIYHLSDFRREIIKMDGFGTKSYEKLINSIEKSRNVKLENYLVALSIPNIGKSAAKSISKYFNGDYNDFANSFRNSFDFNQLEDFGDIMNRSLYTWWNNEDELFLNNGLVQELNFIVEEKKEVAQNDFVNGKTFCVTGKFVSYTRNELEQIITNRGGKLSGSVSKKTDYLLTNEADSGSSKAKKAAELGTPIMSEKEFLEKVGL